MNIFRIVLTETTTTNQNIQPFGFYIETNANSADEILKSYRKGTEIIGVDIQKCFERGEKCDLEAAMEKIKSFSDENSFDVSEMPDYYSREEFGKDEDFEDYGLVFDVPEYYLLWRATVQVGNPDLIIQKSETDLDIEIGGNSDAFTS